MLRGGDIQIYDLNNGKKLQMIEAQKLSCLLFHDYKLMIGNSSNEIIDVLDFNLSLPVSSKQILKTLKSTGSQFKHLQDIPEEKTEDRCELEKSGFSKKDIVCDLLQDLCIAAEERAAEITECSTLFKEYNDWVGFKEKLICYQKKLEKQCRYRNGVLKFNSNYAKVVDAVNAFIDEFYSL
jgi:hypothetical protein